MQAREAGPEKNQITIPKFPIAHSAGIPPAETFMGCFKTVGGRLRKNNKTKTPLPLALIF